MDSGTTKQKKKKSKKSKKKKQEQVAALVTEVIEPPKKKKDKKKKSKKKNNTVVQSETVMETKSETAAAPKKKKKKSKKKNKNQEKPVQTEETVNASPKQQKKKKNKKVVARPEQKDGKATWKNFYTEDSSLTNTPESDILAFRKGCSMAVSEPSFRPVLTFKQLQLSSDILKCVAGFEKPTPIQSQCWPIMLSGRDVIGIAKTGSGKTLGFLLPALVHIMDRLPTVNVKKGPLLVAIAPTRELAMQIQKVALSAGSLINLSSTCIVGGMNKWDQIRDLKNGVHMVICTPGRLLGLIREQKCSLSQVSYLVLDEADRMLDMGFEPDIRAIVSHIPDKRATQLFSATWPESIQRLAMEFVKNPVRVAIGEDEHKTGLTANKDVTQIVEVVNEQRDKDRRLGQLLKKYHTGKNRILVFVLYKKDVARVENLIRRQGLNVAGISSNYGQAQRSKALADFVKGSTPLLVATDVAARGLDVPNVEYVINYSFPLTIEDYVHRIGRTGRGGSKGTSHTFFCKFDKSLAGQLVSVLKEAGAAVPEDLLKFGTGVKRKQHSMYGAFAGDPTRPMGTSKKVKLC